MEIINNQFTLSKDAASKHDNQFHPQYRLAVFAVYEIIGELEQLLNDSISPELLNSIENFVTIDNKHKHNEFTFLQSHDPLEKIRLHKHLPIVFVILQQSIISDSFETRLKYFDVLNRFLKKFPDVFNPDETYEQFRLKLDEFCETNDIDLDYVLRHEVFTGHNFVFENIGLREMVRKIAHYQDE